MEAIELDPSSGTSIFGGGGAAGIGAGGQPKKHEDLKQMLDNPDVYLHGTAPDRWKLDFGEQLYGRAAELKALVYD